MTPGSTTLRVLVLADGDTAAALEGALAVLSCDVTVVADAFAGMSVLGDEDVDAIVLDFTMSRDDGRVLAYWINDNDVESTVVGVVEPVIGAASGDLDDLCDELVLAPATADDLAGVLGVDPPEDAPRRRLTVKVNAALLDAGEVPVPPEQAVTDEGEKPALIVGLGAHAEAPRYDD